MLSPELMTGVGAMKVASNSKPKAVVQDPARCDDMRNTIGLLKLIYQGEEDIQLGRSREQEV